MVCGSVVCIPVIFGDLGLIGFAVFRGWAFWGCGGFVFFGRFRGFGVCCGFGPCG